MERREATRVARLETKEAGAGESQGEAVDAEGKPKKKRSGKVRLPCLHNSGLTAFQKREPRRRLPEEGDEADDANGEVSEGVEKAKRPPRTRKPREARIDGPEGEEGERKPRETRDRKPRLELTGEQSKVSLDSGYWLTSEYRVRRQSSFQRGRRRARSDLHQSIYPCQVR